jgi:chromosome segregation ATPase
MAERHPSFQFYHGHGLGVLAPGEHIPEPLAPLLQASSEPADQIRGVYAALGGALTRHAGVEDLRADIEQRAATEAALRADIEQHAATEGALRAEVEQHAATEAALRAEVVQHAATAAALRAEVKQHAMSEAALRVDIEQRAATAAALRAEVNSLRIKFEEAERGRLDGEAAASARQAEITSLRGELTAARKVGTAVLASLRSAPIPVSLPPRDARLLTVMLRRFGLPANYLLPSAG